jgi:predicted DNA-binding transcriptional regulator YafY
MFDLSSSYRYSFRIIDSMIDGQNALNFKYQDMSDSKKNDAVVFDNQIKQPSRNMNT